MTQISSKPATATDAEVLQIANSEAWLTLKSAATEFQGLQAQDGSLAESGTAAQAAKLVESIIDSIHTLRVHFEHDAPYLEQLVGDLRKWADAGFGVPDFLDSLVQFQPQSQREDGLLHLVLFPMYTQNGSTNRHLEAVLVQVMWPEFIAELESNSYTNALFVPLR